MPAMNGWKGCGYGWNRQEMHMANHRWRIIGRAHYGESTDFERPKADSRKPTAPVKRSW
jgi:hypothetical protein